MDQCVVGRSAKKPTGWISNSTKLRDSLGVKGYRTSRHCTSISPQVVIFRVLEGLRQELKEVGRLEPLEAGGPTVEEAPPERDWSETYGDSIFVDDCTGAVLDPKLVVEARRLEVECMRKLGVYREATREEMEADGCKPIPVRWLDINKGDQDHMNIRSRLVAQETKRRSTIGSEPKDMAATFAATPPLEAVRMMASLMMTGQLGIARDKRRVLGLYDISRAHFHSPALRPLYVIPPVEDDSIKTGIAKLSKAMCGTRDAGKCFDTKAETSMIALGFKVGVFNPCIYYHVDRDALCVRHGDDFILLAERDAQKWFHDELGKHMLTKHEGTLGPCKDLGDVDEIRCLN
eukprot:71042-Pyramimonas_sp.AAC.1